ncbi:hypothetical protein ACFW9S_35015 [Streptomyces anulatus]
MLVALTSSRIPPSTAGSTVVRSVRVRADIAPADAPPFDAGNEPASG